MSDTMDVGRAAPRFGWLRNSFHRFLLPIKLVFFFQLGAVACLVPFMSVFIQQLGLNATEMGIIFASLPFLALVSKPVTGFFTDRFHSPYRLLRIFFLVYIVFMSSVYFVPPIPGGMANLENCTATTLPNGTDIHCSPVLDPTNSAVRISSKLQYDTILSIGTSVIRSTPQFWMIGMLMVVAWFAYGAAWILDDSVTMRLVVQSPVLTSYGENRAFGTAGYALFAISVGFIMDEYSPNIAHRDFTPAFMAYAVVGALSALITFFLPALAAESEIVRSPGHHVFRRLCTWDVLLFTFGALIIGIDSGILHAYLGWYQAELGASSFLLGITIFVQCCYEAPMMALSGRIIRKLGYHICMFLCLLSFGARFVGCSLIDDPWYVLPIDILHSLGFGLFYATMTSFAYAKSPAGNGATLQGILCAIFEGIGQGAGGLVAGFLYQQFGGKRTWMGYGLFSFGSAVLYAIGCLLLWISIRRKLARNRRTSTEDGISPGDSEDLIGKLLDDKSA